MNKDEMKMIEEMAKEVGHAIASAIKDASPRFGWTISYQDVATELYNADYRKVADDEIVIKKSEYEELKTHIEDLQTKLGAVMLCIKNTHEIDISDLLRKQKQATAREFADALKNKTFFARPCTMGHKVITIADIDETLKEYTRIKDEEKTN